MRVSSIPEPATRSWSTQDVDSHLALAYWIETVCNRFLELEIDTPLREGFRASLQQAELGATTLNVLSATSQCVRRTRAKIAHSRYPVLFLLQLRAGRMRLRQLMHEAQLHPGESVLIDGTAPYELECPEATRALALRLPEPWLRGWIPYPDRMGVRVFSGGGWSGALNAALSNLDVSGLEQLVLPRSTVAEHVVALLTLAVGSAEPPEHPPRLLERFIGTLCERLHEPELSPHDVALEHHISRRSLHYAFARAGTTFVEQLVRLRLERAREMLRDPGRAELPVSDVAAACGFADPSHFARRFRRRFAQAPREYRDAAQRRRDR